jgi:hypothetical protein
MPQSRRDDRPYGDPSRPLPCKEDVPGFSFFFDRWKTRLWTWRDRNTGKRGPGFATRDEAVLDAYAQLRAAREGGSGQTTTGAT